VEEGAAMKAALDAGHGSDTGARANGLIEDEVALDMVSRIGHYLRAAGWETVMTRPDFKLVGITERARVARYASAKVFLSIHCNAAGQSAACGVEAFVANGDERSRKLAEKLVEAVVAQGMRDRGVKWDNESQHSRLGVLRGTNRQMPAVLLELGFLTSPYDSMLLKDKHFRDSAAKAIADVLHNSM
jgi:N-acetylmuramoyl-L-alanine amidase